MGKDKERGSGVSFAGRNGKNKKRKAREDMGSRAVDGKGIVFLPCLTWLEGQSRRWSCWEELCRTGPCWYALGSVRPHDLEM